ncbi:hypothetical protein DPMN_094633, partial [Dreissena polymorpha]
LANGVYKLVYTFTARAESFVVCCRQAVVIVPSRTCESATMSEECVYESLFTGPAGLFTRFV